MISHLAKEISHLVKEGRSEGGKEGRSEGVKE